MIKNILYSLFLHSTLALLIYANFKSSLSEDVIDLTEGVKISLVDLKNLEKKKDPLNNNQIKPEDKTAEKKAEEPLIVEEKKEEVKEEKKPEVKEEKKPEKKEEKPVEKKQVEKKEIKKITKKNKEKTRNKAALKPIEHAKKEFKKIEEEKKEVAKNIKEEKITEEAQDESKEEIKEDKNKKEEQKEEVKEVTEVIPQEVLPPDIEAINLSAREKFNIHSQLNACYLRAKENRKDLDISIIVKVFVLQDGTIDYDENIIDKNRYNNPKETEYKIMIDNVKKALELCSPLRNLPLDKYDVWKEFTIKFGDKPDVAPNQ